MAVARLTGALNTAPVNHNAVNGSYAVFGVSILPVDAEEIGRLWVVSEIDFGQGAIYGKAHQSTPALQPRHTINVRR